ncbi:PEP/pyruvate-binding domain-containing protein [Amycolatopsis acidiphila]|uniref:Phosphoenolpyruvate synthase n=1 Tax=Amycolatopsis acidiphila TaxID=715473 RepID=A0A558ABQ4_9PSEU|nr:PEP/pyruvate-binding domain-containing protein [Amycolatopsis acidiphila]TVT21699.1 pyruvate kinase [Amycolatopsis acidiphila]UIJ59762.1 PEP/pyruvate-binding domain-containing protein [Amycolatopsis acidiphila]GHG98452.1 hypothetical protein GCM10017788_78560 [Amycolatopsis acidiphila]
MSGQVLGLDELDCGTAVAIGGPKIGRLVELRAAGITVPHGFVLGATAYRRHCVNSGLDLIIDKVLGQLPPAPSVRQLDAASAEIRRAFLRAPMSPELISSVTEAYQNLCARHGPGNIPVAVRSSAAGEDGGQASFAGIFDTSLGIVGTRRLQEAVRDCWASLFTPRALSYRRERGITHQDMPMAVGVLELIPARASGVAFSAHPVTGRTDRIVIEGSWGWGEVVVQGHVIPDHAEVAKSDLRVLRYHIARKEVMSDLDLASGRIVSRPVPQHLRETRVADSDEVAVIAATVRRIEEHYGCPVDVEWVISRDRQAGAPVHIVQARPITTPVTESASLPRTGWDPVAFAFGMPPQLEVPWLRRTR